MGLKKWFKKNFSKQGLVDFIGYVKSGGTSQWPCNAYIYEARAGGDQQLCIPCRRKTTSSGTERYEFREPPYCLHDMPSPEYKDFFRDADGIPSFMAIRPNPYEYHLVVVDIHNTTLKVKPIITEEVFNIGISQLKENHANFPDEQTWFQKNRDMIMNFAFLIFVTVAFIYMSNTLKDMAGAWAGEVAQTNSIMSNIAERLVIIGQNR